MNTVGFIGLGVMGRPMARNLLQAGYRVVVANRSPEPVADLVGAGAVAAMGPRDVAAQSTAVLTCLPDSPDVESVLLGDEGVVACARPDTLVIDMSTVRPATARAVAEAARARGLRPLDAPVSGGEQAAVNGSLSIMVGGEADDAAAAAPLFEALGSWVHTGPAGSGQLVKAANQLIVGGILGLVSEAIVLLDAFGVEAETAVRALAGGLAGNAVIERKAPALLARDFAPGFRVDLHHKDLGIVLETARQAGVATPLTAVTAQLFLALRSAGRGGLDHGAVLTVIEDLSGRS